MAFVVKHYGWQPDLPDQRDFVYKAPTAYTKALACKNRFAQTMSAGLRPGAIRKLYGKCGLPAQWNLK